MSIAAATLGQLLTTQANYEYVIQQQIYWTNKYDSNAATLTKYVKMDEAYEKAYDDLLGETDKEFKIGTHVYASKADDKGNYAVAHSVANAKSYALAKSGFGEKERLLSEELADLDIEYDTMKTMYDTLAQKLQSDKEAVKGLVGQQVTDTGLISGGQ